MGLDIESIRTYCLAKKGTTEAMPFDQDILVFKVLHKIFLFTSFSKPKVCSIKCEPAFALILRDRYAEVTPGFHLNKKHWNSVDLNGSVPVSEVLSWIDQSYDLVVKGLSKRDALLLFA